VTFNLLYRYVETYFNRPSQNDDSFFMENSSLFNPRGRPLGRKSHVGFKVKKRRRVSRVSLDKKALLQAHRYVLFNNNNVDPFQREHIDLIKRQNRNRHSYHMKSTELIVEHFLIGFVNE